MSKAVLTRAFQPGTSATSAHSATANTTIDAACVCNPTGTDANLSVWIVPQNGTAGNANKVYHQIAVNGGQTVLLPALVNQALANGETLQMSASAAGTLTVTVSGRK